MKTALVVVCVLVAVGGAIAGYLATRDEGRRRPVQWTDVTAEIGPARWARPTTSVIHDQSKLAKLFRVATLPPHPRLPHVDFDRRQAVLIAVGPRSSTGYSLEVESVTKRGDRIDVVVRERTPALGDHVTARLTFPYRVITLPAGGGRVHVRYAGRS